VNVSAQGSTRYLPVEDTIVPDGDDATAGAQRWPQHVPLGASAARHWALVVVVTVLGLLVGAGIGYKHAVSYTADARLVVGRTASLQEAEIAGLAPAIESLAGDYARLASTSPVINATEKTLGVTTLPGTIEASPVPSSSVIDVKATAATSAEAVRLANAAAAALTSTVQNVSNATYNDLSPITSQYAKAESTYQSATQQQHTLQDQLDQLVTSIGAATPTAAQSAKEATLNTEIAQLGVQASDAQLQLSALSNQYVSAYPPLTAQEQVIQPVGTALPSGSNRKSYLEAAGLIGLIGGLVLGLAAAVILENRQPGARRSARAA
jgi:capsular polysaccharide biosynthesis protein